MHMALDNSINSSSQVASNCKGSCVQVANDLAQIFKDTQYNDVPKTVIEIIFNFAKCIKIKMYIHQTKNNNPKGPGKGTAATQYELVLYSSNIKHITTCVDIDDCNTLLDIQEIHFNIKNKHKNNKNTKNNKNGVLQPVPRPFDLQPTMNNMHMRPLNPHTQQIAASVSFSISCQYLIDQEKEKHKQMEQVLAQQLGYMQVDYFSNTNVYAYNSGVNAAPIMPMPSGINQMQTNMRKKRHKLNSSNGDNNGNEMKENIEKINKVIRKRDRVKRIDCTKIELMTVPVFELFEFDTDILVADYRPPSQVYVGPQPP